MWRSVGRETAATLPEDKLLFAAGALCVLTPFCLCCTGTYGQECGDICPVSAQSSSTSVTLRPCPGLSDIRAVLVCTQHAPGLMAMKAPDTPWVPTH